MIAKLMSRKKSYERIINNDNNGRTPAIHNATPDLSNTGNRGVGPGSSALSRAQASGNTRKNLQQYYDSTP